MHPVMMEAFERLLAPLSVRGDVLEIGASPNHPTLLGLGGLDGAAIGPGWEILQRDAHDLSMFPDGAFDLVASNAMLEHDPRFWRTLAEARRVLAPGGWLALGVPAFGLGGQSPFARTVRRLAGLPLIGWRWRRESEALWASSLTLGLHGFPGDYYRFSEQAMREVLLEGMKDMRVISLLTPERLIGIGRKPG